MTGDSETPLTGQKREPRVLLFVLIFTGLLLRVVLLPISKGSTDAFFWERIAGQIDRNGLYDTYRFEGSMNNPPLPGLWAGAAYQAAESLDLPFQPIFKIPMVVSDFVTCALLFAIYRSRLTTNTGLPEPPAVSCSGRRPQRRLSVTSRRDGDLYNNSSPLLAAAAFACSLNAILISAHHCNTDSIYAMLCLVSLWLLETKSHPLLAGLALGAAINIKLIPTLLLIPLLGLSKSWKELFYVLLGLGIMSIPYAWVMIDLGHRFRSRVLGYRPAPNEWGFYSLIEWLWNMESFKPYITQLSDRYVAQSKVLIFACILLVTLVLRNRGETNRFRAAAIAIVVFAVVTPAFALQYGAIVGVLLLAYDLRAGVIFGALRGLQLFCDYYLGWDGRRLPVASTGGNMYSGPMQVFATLAWMYLVAFLFRTFPAKLSRQQSKEAI